MKSALAKLGLVLTGLALVLILGEGAARLYYLVAWKVPFFDQLRIRRKHEFGWEGRRVFGPLDTQRFRVLVVGDSMTHGLGISDADLYSSVLGRRLNVEVFTYGGGGYGTLQEYLVVDHYLPIVRPDLVVVQVSFNDFINNSFELERASWLNNNLAIRPYLEGGRIRYRFPSRLGRAASQSRLLYWFAMDSARVAVGLTSKGLLYTVEDDIGPAFAPFQRAIATTEEIFAKLKARVEPIPLLVFAADGPVPYWNQILARQHIPFYDGVPGAIVSEERRLGASLRPDGAHWNVRGHAVAGQDLAGWLVRQEYVGPRR